MKAEKRGSAAQLLFLVLLFGLAAKLCSRDAAAVDVFAPDAAIGIDATEPWSGTVTEEQTGEVEEAESPNETSNAGFAVSLAPVYPELTQYSCPKTVNEYIADLDAQRYAVRELGQRCLTQMLTAEIAAEIKRRLAAGQISLEQRIRLERVLSAAEGKRVQCILKGKIEWGESEKGPHDYFHLNSNACVGQDWDDPAIGNYLLEVSGVRVRTKLGFATALKMKPEEIGLEANFRQVSCQPIDAATAAASFCNLWTDRSYKSNLAPEYAVFTCPLSDETMDGAPVFDYSLQVSSQRPDRLWCSEDGTSRAFLPVPLWYSTCQTLAGIERRTLLVAEMNSGQTLPPRCVSKFSSAALFPLPEAYVSYGEAQERVPSPLMVRFATDIHKGGETEETSGHLLTTFELAEVVTKRGISVNEYGGASVHVENIPMDFAHVTKLLSGRRYAIVLKAMEGFDVEVSLQYANVRAEIVRHANDMYIIEFEQEPQPTEIEVRLSATYAEPLR